MKRRKPKLNATERFLKNQRHSHTRFGTFLPPAGAYRKIAPADRRALTSIMKNWQSNSPTRQAKALDDASLLAKRLQFDRGKNKGKNVLTLNQMMKVNKYRLAMIEGAKERTRLADHEVNQIKTALDDKKLREINTNKTKPKITKVKLTDRKQFSRIKQAGGSYIGKKEYYPIKRLTEFRASKTYRKAFEGFNEKRFKEIVENFIIYEEYDHTATVIDGNSYFGSFRTVRNAMEVIYAELNDDSVAPGEIHNFFKKQSNKVHKGHTKRPHSFVVR